MSPKNVYNAAEKIAALIEAGKTEEAKKALDALKIDAVKEASKWFSF